MNIEPLWLLVIEIFVMIGGIMAAHQSLGCDSLCRAEVFLRLTFGLAPGSELVWLEWFKNDELPDLKPHSPSRTSKAVKN